MTDPQPAATWPPDAPPALPKIHITIRRSPREALAAGDTHAGEARVPLTRAMIDALTPEERMIFNHIDVVTTEGSAALSFARFGEASDSALPFAADEVSEATVTAALRSVIATEIVRRENLAAEIRANFGSFIGPDGYVAHVEYRAPGHLRRTVGPQHAALDELGAFSEEARRRIAAKREAQEERNAAERLRLDLDAINEYIARSDDKLIHRSQHTSGVWWPYGYRTSMAHDPLTLAALRAQNEHAVQLAKAANERDMESMREFARAVPELAPLVAEGYDVTEGVIRHTVAALRSKINSAEGVVGFDVLDSPPRDDADNPDVEAADITTWRAVKAAVGGVTLPPGATVEVSRIRGSAHTPYVLVTLSSQRFGSRYLAVKLPGHPSESSTG